MKAILTAISGWTLMMGCGLAADAPGVAQIMARVGVNQQAALDARQSFVYRQNSLLRMFRGSGKLAREERAEYVVTPGKEKIEKKLAQFEGKYEQSGKYTTYTDPSYKYRGMDIDGDLLHSMAGDMLNDKSSRDGIGHDLFPLTPAEQAKYEFRLVGMESFRGHPSYRVAFRPAAGRHEDQGGSWKGEALIDAAELQPVQVFTSLAAKIPGAVKVLLGTDIKGLGFSVSYQKFGEGVWFPVSYGGEFEVRGLFFYKRKISVSMANSDFRKTDVNSTVAFATEAH